jgi:hypothetical protein
MSDGVNSELLPAIGGTAGNKSEWVVPEGQYITQAEIWWTGAITSLSFITNQGVKFTLAGN